MDQFNSLFSVSSFDLSSELSVFKNLIESIFFERVAELYIIREWFWFFENQIPSSGFQPSLTFQLDFKAFWGLTWGLLDDSLRPIKKLLDIIFAI